MKAKARCQGAVIQDHKVLLIQHHYFESGERWWEIPGGAPEEGESEEAAVAREMKEETGLEVKVERLLFEDLLPGGTVYDRYLTFLCIPLAGEARPGYEPEEEAARVYEISAVRWVDLRDETSWGDELLNNWVMAPLLKRIQSMLGYST